MIRSMTGYCSVRESLGEMTVLLEIKSLNQKGFDFHYHSPRSLSMLELPIRDAIKERIPRGRIEVFLKGSQWKMEGESIQANVEVARQYLEAGRSVAEALQLPFAPPAEYLLTLGGVLETEERTSPVEESLGLFKELVMRAVDDMVKMKHEEGAALQAELERLLNRIMVFHAEVATLRPAVIEEYRQKLIERIQEWSGMIELDPNRVIQEMGFYADRSDVQEELVRLEGHVEQFRKALNQNDDETPYSPIGRRMDFLCQEMFREVNTIGSKSSSLEIVRRVVELKTLVDQLREQVQNVE